MKRASGKTGGPGPGLASAGRGSGLVSLVGAGPGDPALLTAAARERIRRADVVLHDALVPPGVLALVPQRARLVPAGRRAGGASCGPRQVEERMIAEARAGASVVRLKGGDPLLFGRAWEEITALREAGIRFEIVPGISAAFGAAAACAVPLTERDGVHAVRFATATTAADGDAADGSEATDPCARWAEDESLVLYMAGRRLARVAARLLCAGCPPETPAVLIERATWPDCRSRRLRLADLGDPALAETVRTPALLIIGRTAREGGGEAAGGEPAAGGTVALVGVLQEFSWWTPRLLSLGLAVVELAVARAVAPARALAPADWRDAAAIRFSDVHTVEPFFEALRRSGADARSLAGLRLEAADPPTASALRRRGIRPDRIGEGLRPPAGHSAGTRTHSRHGAGTLRLVGPTPRPGPRDRIVYDLEPICPDLATMESDLARCSRRIFTSPRAAKLYAKWREAIRPSGRSDGRRGPGAGRELITIPGGAP